jgi:hypothetical protein
MEIASKEQTRLPYRPVSTGILLIILLGLDLFPQNADAHSERCASEAYVYEAIDVSVPTVDSISAIMRRNTEATRKIVSNVPRDPQDVFIDDDSWIATFYIGVDAIFSISKYDDRNSNYRRSVTVYFDNWNVFTPQFQFLALSLKGGSAIEYDLGEIRKLPPDELLLTVDSYRSIANLVLQGRFARAETDEAKAAVQTLDVKLRALLKDMTGAWKIDSCAEE